MGQISLIVGDRQDQELRSFASQTGLTLCESMRRMIDHCMQEIVKNEIVPCMSGRFSDRGPG